MYKTSNKSVRAAGSLDAQLERQLTFLDRSAKLFDEGHDDEAIRLATTLRTLLHDGTGSSLLTLLGVNRQLSFVNTGVYRHLLDAALDAYVAATSKGGVVVSNSPADVGLLDVGISRDGAPSWVAPLRTHRFRPGTPPHEAQPERQPFDEWWTCPLVQGSSMTLYSRRQLVLVMANQEGGAHVDARIDQDYEELLTDFLGVELELNGPDRTMQQGPLGAPVRGTIAFLSVRQIAFEVAETLNAHTCRNGYSPTPPQTIAMPMPILIGYTDGT